MAFIYIVSLQCHILKHQIKGVCSIQKTVYGNMEGLHPYQCSWGDNVDRHEPKGEDKPLTSRRKYAFV